MKGVFYLIACSSPSREVMVATQGTKLEVGTDDGGMVLTGFLIWLAQSALLNNTE